MAKTTKSLKIQQLKNALVQAMEKSLGVVTTACRNVGCDRSTFYEYYNNDEDFKNEIDSLKNVALDFAESQLHQKMKKGDTTAIIFYLKTQGKDRGYVETRKIDYSHRKEVADVFPDLEGEEESDEG